MNSAEIGKCTTEIQEEHGSKTPKSCKGTDQISLFSITSQREDLNSKPSGKRFSDIAKTKLMKFKSITNFSSHSKFRRVRDDKREASNSVSSTNRISTKHSRMQFIKKLNWEFLWDAFKTWMKNPMNMALSVWIICVAISGAVLFMVMSGMLNGALRKKSQRDMWFEVSNQILNALFTLMCLYQHPKRLHHLALWFRWGAHDVQRLRTLYCKKGMQKPNEKRHILVVVALLNLNCFAQYALCAFNIGYPRSKRPAIVVGLCTCIAFGAAAIASVYNILSPLGREYGTEADEEAQNHVIFSPDKRRSFISESTQWKGGLFDLWDDIWLAYSSLFCVCCVFGWNMDRLGFGNMYVHTVTFLLFCLAPFFIFNFAAVNIDNEAFREVLGITGFVLCILGLLYGGFWRIRMRKRFNLPGNSFCCGKPDVTDCFQWLCCYSCSLAQEVRTADYYEAVDGEFYMKQSDDDALLGLSPLPREGGLNLKSNHSSPCWEGTGLSISSGNVSDKQLHEVDQSDHISMIPPVHSAIQREENSVT